MAYRPTVLIAILLVVYIVFLYHHAKLPLHTYSKKGIGDLAIFDVDGGEDSWLQVETPVLFLQAPQVSHPSEDYLVGRVCL